MEIQEVVLNEFMGFTYVCNKKYLLILFFLDTCVEPYFYRRGLNFYQDGQNYALASLIYYTAQTFWGKDELESLLYCFQRASKTKLDFNIQTLIEKARSLRGRELSENLIPLINEDESCIEELKNRRNSTDAALVVLLSFVSHLEKFFKEKYQIIHDTSENLRSYNRLIKRFIDVKDDITFKETLETKLSFPLKLAGVEQKDSKSNCGIQLADLLIGGMTEHAGSMNGTREKNDYNQKIPELYGKRNLLHLLPDLDFEESRKYRTGSDALQFIEFISAKVS